MGLFFPFFLPSLDIVPNSIDALTLAGVLDRLARLDQHVSVGITLGTFLKPIPNQFKA